MAIGENQTASQAIRNVKPTDQGSGVFAVPDPTIRESGAFTKIIVPGITYPECIRRGQNCIAFKWVPKTLSQGNTSCPTPGALCTRSCAHELCLCIDGTCQ